MAVAQTSAGETATFVSTSSALRAELEKYLRKLEELKAEGKISDRVYQAFKEEL